MMIRVESPADEYKKHLEETPEPYSLDRFLMGRCLARQEVIEEISHELAELRLNYNEVLKRLRKYEPTEELPETQYIPFEGIKWGE